MSECKVICAQNAIVKQNMNVLNVKIKCAMGVLFLNETRVYQAVAYCPLCSIEDVEDELAEDYQNSDPSLSENEESSRSPTPPPSKVKRYVTF